MSLTNISNNTLGKRCTGNYHRLKVRAGKFAIAQIGHWCFSVGKSRIDSRGFHWEAQWFSPEGILAIYGQTEQTCRIHRAVEMGGGLACSLSNVMAFLIMRHIHRLPEASYAHLVNRASFRYLIEDALLPYIYGWACTDGLDMSASLLKESRRS